ncbi:SPRY domain-containing protein [Xylariales sp. PMI_506]|nr:SPRY domain-containing protein [Xylariales sp. PMI_506]
MANPYQQGSPGVPLNIGYNSLMSRMRTSSYASVVSGTNSPSPASPGPFNRISGLAHHPNDTTPELYATHQSSFRAHNNSMHAAGGLTAADGSAPLLPRVPQLPASSRAFEMFLNPAGDSFWSSQYRHNGFFTPSYLRGSSYIQKLEEAHRLRQAQREVQQQPTGTNGLQTNTNSSMTIKPATHLGMTYDLIERAPSLEDDDTIAPLPTRWNKDDKHGGLEVIADGQEVKYTAPKPAGERDHEAYAIRTDHAVPPQAGIYYYEVTIMSRKRDETAVYVGFTAKTVSLARPPGWENDSYGYHGDDGNIYTGHNQGKHYGPPFTTGDTIGCGINFRTGNAFFTKNGVNLGIAFRDMKGKLYPVIGMKRTGEHVRVNFGQTPFVYDIDGMMKQEQAKIKKAISDTSTDKLASPSLGETELIQQLVLQFLQHDGYVETARAFAEEIQAEKKSLTLDPSAPLEGINIKDDEDANRRQRIRRAVLEGDIDKAFKYMTAYYPHVLKDNEQVYFKLRCRKFIEMVRKSAEFNLQHNGGGKRTNGHAVDDGLNEMDLDENGFSDKMETEDGVDSTIGGETAMLAEAIAYGQELQEEFKGDARREVIKALGDVFSLLAYPEPFQVKEVAHLLDRRGRAAVAEELNSAILLSLGRSSRSALENLYGQTSVLLDYLREEGGPGSFVTMQSVVDEIPKAPF